ncbi:MAG: ADP-ribosylglycohydrolase family protein [Desulfurococcales archaeon]|nr:ADP-ribosylglycohydrolase family protein [Desulfurococcales archaeon]
MPLGRLEAPLEWGEAWAARIRGGMLGLAVGDALGLPWELKSGEEVRRGFRGEMVGGGTWGVPAGTWSDDTSQTLALVDTLASDGADPEAFVGRLLLWLREGRYTPDGVAFNVGPTTLRVLEAIAGGASLEGAAAMRPSCGSLMRCFPVAAYTLCSPLGEAVGVAHRMSAATHAHPLAMMACGLYTVVIRGVFAGLTLGESVAAAGEALHRLYSGGRWGRYARRFRYLEDPAALAAERPRRAVCEASKMLRAALWSVLSTRSLREALVEAVRLGGDTDTVAAIAGSVAGAYYGPDSIPPGWLSVLRARALVEDAAARLASTVRGRCPGVGVGAGIRPGLQ